MREGVTHGLVGLGVYLGAVFAGGGLLAPWLYRAAAWLSGFVPFLEGLKEAPFHRFVHRSLLLVALIGIIPLLRWFRLGSWQEIGFRRTSGWAQQAAAGFGVGFVSLGGLAAIALASGQRVLSSQVAEQLWAGLLGAGVSAVIVAVLEELLFRGVIFGGLRSCGRAPGSAHGPNWVGAMLISSAIYSLVHFFQRPPIQPAEITWKSGLEMLPVMARGLGEVETLAPAFFVLLVAGMVLAAAYQRTGALYFSIGLHGGWIFWQKSYGLLTAPMAETSAGRWGNSMIIDSWLALVALMFLLAWVLRPAEAAAPTQPMVKRA